MGERVLLNYNLLYIVLDFANVTVYKVCNTLIKYLSVHISMYVTAILITAIFSSADMQATVTDSLKLWS